MTGTLGQKGRQCLLVGAGGLVLCAFTLLVDHQLFFVSYLEAYLFWLGATLGCLAILMINNLVGGNWGVLVRPFLESASQGIPLMATLFVPLLFGVRDLYVWARPEGARLHNHPYLNFPFFAARLVFYFVIWMALRRWMNRNPLLVPTPTEKRRLQRRSAIGLGLFGLTVSFAGFDWVMSIDPTWVSNMYGLIFGVGELLTAMAFAIVMVTLVRARLLKQEFPTQSLHDCGNLLLVFVMFWAYISFSQFLIIWSGQMPSDYKWYHQRTVGGWKWVGYGLIVLHFGVPFLLLLSRTIKRNAQPILWVALFVLGMRCVDTIWQVSPAFYDRAYRLPWAYFLALAGIGGIWLWAFFGRLGRTDLFPPSLPPSLPKDRPREGMR